MPVWSRLIRFESTDGRLLRGEPILPSPNFDVGSTIEGTKLQAKVIEGQDIYDTTGKTKVTDEIVTVKKLLGPLAQEDVPIVRCIGLNFLKHIKEGGRTPPPFPSVFYKANTTVNDHGAPVVIPKICQDEQADYEGELCFIIGKDAKDVPESEASNYISAYTCGNDVSSRKLQRDPALAGGVPQWGFSKGFDTFCPLGPCLVSSSLIPDPSTLKLITRVDGEVRQSEGIDDLCFKIPYLVAYCSQGTTLKAGTVVMTGTPSGVGFAMKPPRYLKPGNEVEVEISGIGTLKNSIVFA